MSFTFIESILENVNDVVCSSFLSNEENTDIFYYNDNDTIKTFFSLSVMKDKTIVYYKYNIISNIKLQIIFPNHFVVGSHEYKLRYCYCTYNKHNVFQWKHFKLTWDFLSKWWYQDCFDKITFHSDTYPELSHENRNYTLAYV